MSGYQFLTKIWRIAVQKVAQFFGLEEEKGQELFFQSKVFLLAK